MPRRDSPMPECPRRVCSERRRTSRPHSLKSPDHSQFRCRRQAGSHIQAGSNHRSSYGRSWRRLEEAKQCATANANVPVIPFPRNRSKPWPSPRNGHIHGPDRVHTGRKGTDSARTDRVAMMGSPVFACFDIFPSSGGEGECVIRTIVDADNEVNESDEGASSNTLGFKANIQR